MRKVDPILKNGYAVDMINLNELEASAIEQSQYKDKLIQIALDEMEHFVGILDTKGTLLEVNRAALNASGLKRSEVIGKPIFKTFWWNVSKKTAQNLKNSIVQAFRGEIVRFDVEVYGLTREHETRLIDFSLKPIKDIAGKVLFLLAEGHDNTSKIIHEREIAHILMQAPIGICIFEGPQHIFKLANTNYHSLMFDQKLELLGKPFIEALPELKDQEFQLRLDEVYKTGKSYVGTEMLVRIISKNNSIKKIFIDLIYQPVRGTDNQVKGVFVVITDTTEKVKARKKVIDSEMRYRSLTESIPQLIWIITPEGEISYANERCLQFMTLDSIRNFVKNWPTIIHPEDAVNSDKKWQECMKTEAPYVNEYRLKGPDGNYHWFLDRIIPIKNKKNIVQFWISSATDIQVQKNTAAELAIAKELAEHANATKSAFLANMSHEIRTPLGAILGFSGLLKDINISNLERDQYIKTIERNGLALTRIIDDILDLAKVEAGKLDIEEIDFSFFDLLNEVVDLFREKAKQRNIYFNLKIGDEVPKHISTDPTRLRQILINIIGNAIKFTSFGEVEVVVKVNQNIEGALRLAVYVKDTGPGLTQEQKSRLFKPFSQGDNTMTRQYGGTGLGLVLSQRLSRALGGEITIVDCMPGKGCTFIISFVATITKKLNKNTVKNFQLPLFDIKLLPLKDIKVLVVDDSADNQFLVKRLLTKNGAYVDLANDGEEAIAKAVSTSYDIILMDIQMPKMDGYQAIEILNQKKYRIPIVALTAHAMLEDQNNTKKAGFLGHLTKPINMDELIQTVRKLTVYKSFSL